MNFDVKKIAALSAGQLVLLLSASIAGAQNFSNAGTDWNSSYNFPSASSRSVALQGADLAKKAETGYYDNIGRSSTTLYNNIDRSTGAVTVTAADGAYVDVGNQTGEDSGISTYSVGAVNNVSSTISGTGNAASITADSLNSGCQDGRIVSTSGTGQIDISTGAAAGSVAGNCK